MDLDLFYFIVRYSALLHLPPPQIPLCRRMLGSNPGVLRLRQQSCYTVLLLLRIDGFQRVFSVFLKNNRTALWRYLKNLKILLVIRLQVLTKAAIFSLWNHFPIALVTFTFWRILSCNRRGIRHHEKILKICFRTDCQINYR